MAIVTLEQANRVQACLEALETACDDVIAEQGLQQDRMAMSLRGRAQSLHGDFANYYAILCGGDLTALSGGGNKTEPGD